MAKERHSQETVSTKNCSQSNALLQQQTHNIWIRTHTDSVCCLRQRRAARVDSVCSISEYRKHRFKKEVKDAERYDSRPHIHLQKATCSSRRITTHTKTDACTETGNINYRWISGHINVRQGRQVTEAWVFVSRLLLLLEAQLPWLCAECLDCSSKATQGITGHMQKETGQEDVWVRPKTDGMLDRWMYRQWWV